MIDTMAALDIVVTKRGQFLQKICKKQGGTVADWKLANFFNEKLLSIQDFVDESGLDMSTLSRQVNRAEDRGFIFRESSSADRRRSLFKTTESGKNFILTINQSLSDYDEKLFENWSKEEFSMLNILMNRILKNMNK